MKTTTTLRCCAAVLLAASASLAHAIDFTPDGFSVQAGPGRQGAAIAGVGVLWDWNFERMRRKAELTAHTEFLVNEWRTDRVGGGKQSLTQFVLLPSLRMRLAQGASPWYFEVGVGASWMNKRLVTPDKEFSTQWNFFDVLGAGYTFGGPNGKHEIGARWVHTSNAGIKNPNPGQDFLQLRYVNHF